MQGKKERRLRWRDNLENTEGVSARAVCRDPGEPSLAGGQDGERGTTNRGFFPKHSPYYLLLHKHMASPPSKEDYV